MSASATKVALPKLDKNDDWELHFKKLDWYFTSNNIEPSKRVQILLTSVTPPVYKVLREASRPELPKNKTFEELSEMVRVGFSQVKRKSIYKERTVFYRAAQAENESVRHWYLRLKGLATACEFGARVNSVLRDKFVTGITNQKVLNRLYEVSPTVSLNDVLKIAINEENPSKKCCLKKWLEKDSEKNATKDNQEAEPNKKQRCKKNREIVWQQQNNLKNNEIDLYVHQRPICGDSFNFRERAQYYRVDSDDERYCKVDKSKRPDEVKLKN